MNSKLRRRFRVMISILILFALIGTMLFAAINVAALAMTDITVTSDESTKSGLPLNTVDFTLTYVNNNQVDSAKLRNWKLEPNFGASTGTNWNATLVNADENMTIPPNGGQRKINVIARIGKYAVETLLQQIKVSVDVYDSSSKIGTKQKIVFVDVEQTYEQSVINKTGDPDTKPRGSNGKAIFKFTVNNLGNGQDTISFTTSGPFKDITFSGDSRSMDPFSYSNYTMTINNIPEDLTKGTHTTVVNVQSENTTMSPAQHPFDVEIPAQYDLTLQLNETKANKEVVPGKSTTFNFTLINDGNTKDHIKITYGFKASAPGWTLLVNKPGEDFNIKKDEIKDVQIEVSAPPDQSYPFTVPIFMNCSSQNNISIYKNSTVNAKIKQISEIKLVTSSGKTLNINTLTASFKINVSNDGNGEDTINFDPISTSIFPAGEIWSYEFFYRGASISSITIPSNEFRDGVYLNFTSPDNPKKGSYTLYLNASSDNDPSIKVSYEIKIHVKDRFNIELISKSGLQHSAYPGDTIPIVIQGKNIGNVEGTFNLNIKKPANADTWDTPVFEPPVFLTMAVDEIRNSYLNITVHNNAQKGFYLFVVNATKGSGGGYTEEYDSFVLNISVKRKYEVKLILDNPTIKTKPGTSANFKFTVQNKGTGSCNVTMEASMAPIPETYMNVKITPSSFHLPTATATQIVWVNITPSDESPLAPMNTTGVPITINADITEKLGNPDSSKEVKVQINQSYGVDIYISELYKNIEPGGTDFVMITVTNDGNGEDSFGISPTPPPGRTGWKVKAIPTSTGLLSQGESKEIKINITVPGTESVVTDNVTINVTSIGDKSKSTSEIESIRIIVEETRDVRFVNTDNRKEVEPGSYVHFSVELENIGTVDDKFRLDVVVPPTSELIDHELNALMDVDSKQRNSTTLNITVSDSDIDKLPDQDNITVEVRNSDDTVTIQRTYTIDITSVRGVRLSSSPLEQKGKPKETLNYQISIENTGTGKDKFALKILPNPPYSSWAVLKNIGEFTGLMDPGNITYANVEVEIPAKRSPSPPYGKITILAESKENPEKNHTITLTIDIEQVFKLKVTAVATTQEVNPGENWTFQFNVKNDGTGIDTVELKVDKTEDTESIKSVTLDTYYLTLKPGETKPVYAKITAVDEPEEGKLNPKVKITAESLNDTDDTPANDNDEVELEINPTVDIELEVDGDIKQDVVPNLSGTKVEVEYTVKVWNRGLGKDDFDIEEYNNHGFPVDISPTTTNKIDSGSSTTVTVKITIDNMAPMSSIDYNTTITVTSRTNTDKSELITLKTRIKQAYGVELQVLDETIETEETFVGNNRIVTFLVDVENIGTGEDTFKLELSGTNANWATLSDSYYKLDSRDNQTLSVRVKIPRKTSIGDIPITLTAISRGDDDKYDDSKDSTDEETLTVDVTQFYEIKMDSTEQLLTGVPGDNIEFTISVNNRGNGEDTADIRRKNYDPDWSWTLSARRIDLGPIGDSDGTDVKEIKLSVDIPTDENGKSGYYNISIYVYSDTPEGLVIQNDGEPLLFTVKVEPTYDVDVILDYPSSSSDEEADPGKDIDYQITIKNKGNNLDTFTISVSGSKASWVNLPEKTVQIEPYKSSVVSFTVEIPELSIDTDAIKEIKADTYTITIKVTSEGDQDQFDEIDIRPSVNKEYNIRMESDDVSLDIDDTTGLITVDPEAEQNYERFTLTIKNLGNTIDTISLTTKTTDWKVKYDNQLSKTISLDIGVSKTVTVEISAPDKAKDGDSERLTITAKSADETKTNFYIKATVETAVIKFGKMTIDGNQNVGSTITVTLQVRNDGNVDAEDIEVKFYDVDKSETIHTATIDKISGNSVEEISFSYKLEEGEHEIFAETPWAGETEKKTGSTFTSETELFSMANPLFWILIIIVLLVVFIIGAFIGSIRHSSGLPQDLRDEIAMAKQASKMGKSPEEINRMRRKKLDGGELGDRKKMGMKGESEFRVNEEKEKPSKRETGKTTKIKCPNCDRIQTVTSTARPIEFPCSKCGMKLVLKK